MKKVTVCASKTYDILIERGLIKNVGKLMADAKISPCRVAILTLPIWANPRELREDALVVGHLFVHRLHVGKA